MVEFLGTRFLCAAISNPLSHPEKAGLTLSNNEGVSRKLLVSAPGRFLSVSINVVVLFGLMKQYRDSVLR